MINIDKVCKEIEVIFSANNHLTLSQDDLNRIAKEIDDRRWATDPLELMDKLKGLIFSICVNILYFDKPIENEEIMIQRTLSILKDFSPNLASRVLFLFRSMEDSLHSSPSTEMIRWAVSTLDPFTGGCGLQIMTLAMHQNKGDDFEKDLEAQIRKSLEGVDPQVRDVGIEVWGSLNQ